MTLTVLASFSFLALVVTARPILEIDSPHDSLTASKPAQDAVQAFFQSRTGLSPPPTSDIKIHLTTPAEQHRVLEQIGLDAVKVLAPVQDEEERKLYEAIGGKLDDLDGGVGEVAERGSELGGGDDSLVVEKVQQASESEGNNEVLKSEEKNDVPYWTNAPLSEPPELLVVTVSRATTPVLPPIFSESEQHPDPDLLPLPSVSVAPSPSSTPSPLPPILNLPSNPSSPLPSTNALPSIQTPPRSPARKPLQMREIPQTPGQPTWATLASATVSTSDLSIPGGLPLAMFEPAVPSAVGGVQDGQLRRMAMPMADPAWMVRLLVHALWGWMAVFVGGTR
ncbi:hypothetical protein NEOLEDRAFT_87575 [Neolentinus lepideus HHB14362 ss-1]|uniref:Uncharacterized protein n=1 Tax=Neolentinus lepideus HHB14362 ss-1 TaxID=1314782 RepID=A0A165MWW4_9AGAM|nr:hypothetical protein NEOLEDRAFT_87575 [Neolentinus lepideus HHB14362 ss-1]